MCAVALMDFDFAKTLTTSFLPNTITEITNGTTSAALITLEEENNGGSSVDNFKILPSVLQLEE